MRTISAAHRTYQAHAQRCRAPAREACARFGSHGECPHAAPADGTRTRARVLLPLFCAVLAACGVEQTPPAEDRPADLPRTAPAAAAAPAAADTARALAFSCQDAFQFTLVPRETSATLFLPDTTLELERTPAPIGERFARAGVELWHDSVQATLDLPDTTREACDVRHGADPWAAARLRGAIFRAVGQEPGWYVEVRPDSLIYFGDYGERVIRTATPPLESDGRRAQWRTGPPADLLVVAERRACEDAMSGERSSHTVSVTAGGSTVHGCGRQLNRLAS